MKAQIVLLAGLIAACIGMAMIFIGVLSPGLFYPGVFILGLGLLTSAVAGVIAITERPQT
jgi:hypothetical protein